MAPLHFAFEIHRPRNATLMHFSFLFSSKSVNSVQVTGSEQCNDCIRTKWPNKWQFRWQKWAKCNLIMDVFGLCDEQTLIVYGEIWEFLSWNYCFQNHIQLLEARLRLIGKLKLWCWFCIDIRHYLFCLNRQHVVMAFIVKWSEYYRCAVKSKIVAIIRRTRHNSVNIIEIHCAKEFRILAPELNFSLLLWQL